MNKIIISLLLLGAMLNSAMAVEGNATDGQVKAAMCGACHGANGLNPSPTYPNLAGQHADYLVKQLKSFKDGSRVDAVMAPMAVGLSEQDMADIAAFFAAQPRVIEPEGSSADGTVAQISAPVFEPSASIGKSLYELGDPTRSIAACIGCHGKDGHSDVLIYPNLAKQHAEYVTKQLTSFKTGERVDPAMNQFAGNLTDEEIAHIGAYLEDTSAVADVKVRAVSAPSVLTDSAIAGKDKAQACAACHGNDGNSLVAMYPKLAGQSAGYLLKQLRNFKDGSRVDAVMAGMVAGLSDDDMNDLANYFAAQTISRVVGDENANGRKLYFGGDATREITACVACHGVNGNGMDGASFPAIASQSAEYIKIQLEKFRSGTRTNDKNKMMQDVVMNLEDSDIAALSQFISTLK